VVIGPRENVFHTPPTVEQHDSFHGVPRRLGRRLSRSGGVTGEGTVHLLHFARPYRHARHYAGWTHDLAARLAEHRAGRGARLLSVFVDAGIGWELARTWPDSSRTRERALKRQGGASRRCPLCGVRPRLPRECPPGVSRP
jgi:predicted GIY-YIG superfamily endonuclease